MLDGRFRSQVEACFRPLGQSAKRAGIPADAITPSVSSCPSRCAIAVGAGALGLGLLLLILTGIPDTLDGAVAKASGTSSPRGAFFDSVSDRITDALLFGGVAWYLSTLPNSSPRLPVLVFAAFATAVLPSYIRAKADALGIDGRGGLVERAERFVILGLGLLFPSLLVASLWVLVVLNLATSVQRFVNVWKQADKPVRTTTPAGLRRRTRTVARGTAAERWQARRTQKRADRTAPDVGTRGHEPTCHGPGRGGPGRRSRHRSSERPRDGRRVQARRSARAERTARRRRALPVGGRSCSGSRRWRPAQDRRTQPAPRRRP